MDAEPTNRPAFPGAPPTGRQIWALAGALCERMGETFPETRGEASELIERLRIENGHPHPHLEETRFPPPRPRRGRRRRRRFEAVIDP